MPPQHLSAVHTWHTGGVLPDPLSPHPCPGPQATTAPRGSPARGGPGRTCVRPSAPAQHTAGSPVWRCAPGTRAGDGDGSAKDSWGDTPGRRGRGDGRGKETGCTAQCASISSCPEAWGLGAGGRAGTAAVRPSGTSAAPRGHRGWLRPASGKSTGAETSGLTL